jgi:hypothetical protein
MLLPVLRSVGGAPTPAVGEGARAHVLSNPVELMLYRAFPGDLEVKLLRGAGSGLPTPAVTSWGGRTPRASSSAAVEPCIELVLAAPLR